MTKERIKRTAAALAAVTLLTSVSAGYFTPLAKVSANSEVLGETSFDYKILPWHLCQSAPAKQVFEITPDGELHITLLRAWGADKEQWDLQLRHRNLNFKAGHRYTVSFKAKAKRDGMELCSHISNIKGDEEYCVLDGDSIHNGPHNGGQWGSAAKLTTEWQTFSGEFTPEKDIEAAEWAFLYAKGTQYEGNAIDGDEIWFDDMSVQCTVCEGSPCTSCGYDPRGVSWYTTRSQSGVPDNYISVNQEGYYTGLSKTAVLGDNSGDIKIFPRISLTEDSYDFDVVDAETDEAVYSGKSGSAVLDRDSGDTVYRLDFSDFKKPGEYYIRAGEYVSMKFRIGNDIYSEQDHNLLTNALNYFYQNRSGVKISEEYITSGDKRSLAHSGGHITDTAFVQKEWEGDYLSGDDASGSLASSELTANGGWYESGNHGKHVVNSGMALWTLQNMYENAVLSGNESKFSDGSGTVVIPENGNDIPDILDEAAYELDWMSQMVVKPDEPEWGEYAGMVYHSLQDHCWTGLATVPWDYENEWGTVRIVKPPSFAATLNYAACAAQAARLWEPYDSERAAKYLSEAKNSYEAFEKNWYQADMTGASHPDFSYICCSEDLNKKSMYVSADENQSGSSYSDYDVKDEAYWAACEIFVSAKVLNDKEADAYYDRLSGSNGILSDDMPVNMMFKIRDRIPSEYKIRGEGDSLASFNWQYTDAAGTLTLALHTDLLPEDTAAEVKKSLTEAADEFLAAESSQGYGIPYEFNRTYNLPNDGTSPLFTADGYEYGSNQLALNNAVVMAYAYNQTKNEKYLNGVSSAMDYIMGKNPLSYSFVTGYGSYHAVNPRHRYWSNELDKSLPSAPDGVLVSGPNAGLQDVYIEYLGFVPGGDIPSQRCYADSVESTSSNDAGLSINASLAWVVSFLQDNGGAAGNEDAAVNDNKEDSGEKETGNLTGDVNCDGKVDVTDITVLAVALVDNVTLDSQAAANADTDRNGTVHLADLAKLRQYISKQINEL